MRTNLKTRIATVLGGLTRAIAAVRSSLSGFGTSLSSDVQAITAGAGGQMMIRASGVMVILAVASAAVASAAVASGYLQHLLR